jgi:anthranilate synthase component I
VVADSVPAIEYQECLNKARALLRALDEAEVISAARNYRTEPVPAGKGE